MANPTAARMAAVPEIPFVADDPIVGLRPAAVILDWLPHNDLGGTADNRNGRAVDLTASLP